MRTKYISTQSSNFSAAILSYAASAFRVMRGEIRNKEQYSLRDKSNLHSYGLHSETSVIENYFHYDAQITFFFYKNHTFFQSLAILKILTFWASYNS